MTLGGKVLWDKRARDDDAFPDPADVIAQLPKA